MSRQSAEKPRIEPLTAEQARALLLAQGVPLVIVRDTLGHTQISTTADIYGHVFPETHRDAVDSLDALLNEESGDEDKDAEAPSS